MEFYEKNCKMRTRPPGRGFMKSYYFFGPFSMQFSLGFVSKIFIRIYSDIGSYHFLDTNIFGYSFVSKSRRMSEHDLVTKMHKLPAESINCVAIRQGNMGYT